LPAEAKLSAVSGVSSAGRKRVTREIGGLAGFRQAGFAGAFVAQRAYSLQVNSMPARA